MVRAVPQVRRKFILPLLLLSGVVLMAGVAVWQWVQARNPGVAVQANGVLAEKPPAEVLSPAPQPDAKPNTPPPHAAQHAEKISPLPNPADVTALRQSKDMLQQRTVQVMPRADAPAEPARPVKPQPVQAAPLDAQPAAQAPDDELPIKQISPAQLADAEFRKAVALMQQGRITDAMAGYEAALRIDAGHDAARQTLVALLLEGKRGADAERVLQEGLKSKPEHTGFAMLLARLQVERGEVGQATATLEKLLPYADSQADYQAFFAALLQRQNRHKEAITHYQIALQLVPDNGVWMMGYGISLQAAQRTDDARNAFRRALDSKTLKPELQAFVKQKLNEL